MRSASRVSSVSCSTTIRVTSSRSLNLEDTQFSDRIQVRGRLIQAKYARLDSEHRRYGEALLLAAGEGGRGTVLESFEAYLPEHGLDAPDYLVTLDGEVFRPEGDLQGHVGGEQLGLEVLEDEPHLLGELADPPLTGGAASDAHLSIHLAPEEVGDQTVQRDTKRALPRSRRPHHDHELPLGHLEVHPSERGLLLPPVTVAQSLDANFGFHLSYAPPYPRRI
jgi:hypothetical protein